MARRKKKTESTGAPPNRVWLVLIAVAALAAFIALTLGDLTTNAPTSDETVHLAGGYSYLTTHDYRINPEHPPLLKAFAALPLLGMHVWPARFASSGDDRGSLDSLRDAWAQALIDPSDKEWVFAEYFLYPIRDSALARVGGDAKNPPTNVIYTKADFLNQPDRMVRSARLMMLLVTVTLAMAIFWWSYSLWGLPGAVFSLLLFCFDPNFIAHGGLVTTDVGAACLIFVSAYAFWRCCRALTAFNVAFFAIAFALAQVAKFSSVLLIPMLLVTAVVEFWRTRNAKPALIALAAAAVSTLVVIWAAYDFRFNAAADASGHFPIRDTVDLWYAEKKLQYDMPNGYTIADLNAAKRTTPHGLVGSAVTFMADRHLLPESYLYGFAWTGASGVTRTAYLKGEYSNYGFPSYFFWTFLYKTPIPLMLLMIGGVLAALFDKASRSEIVFLAIPAALYLGYAFTSQLNIGHRHTFPVFPFFYAMAGILGNVWSAQAPRMRAMIGAATIALLAIAANVVLLPRPALMTGRHISYLNALAGGPINGWDKLTDSNFDWGQDIGRLADWLREHDVKEPVAWMVFGNADPRFYGIRYDNYRFTYDLPAKPGYVAISQMAYLGMLFDSTHRFEWREFLARTNARRVGTAGYSIFIYKIDQLP